MTDRLTRVLLSGVVILLAAMLAQPYINGALFSAINPRPVEPRGSLADAERATIAIFNSVSPSVVQVVGRNAGEQGTGPEGEHVVGTQTGTGVIWDRVGHIVTNNHVVEGTNTIVVRLSSGEAADADITGTAPAYDLAVVQLRDTRKLEKPIIVGTSANLQVGQWAFAIGNPFGLDQSLTTGVISALRRRLPTSEGGELADVIQTDAAINPGNSGAPLLDSSGRLIGVTTAILSPSGSNAGIGFAIPVDLVNRIVPELIRRGHVPTPGIGVVVASDAAATQLGTDGVVIVRIVPGSPAARAGLRGVDPSTGALGDVIVGANGAPVHRLADLTDQIQRVGIGHQIALRLERRNRTVAVSVGISDASKSADAG
jgi:S1-C subfamily serine protease